MNNKDFRKIAEGITIRSGCCVAISVSAIIISIIALCLTERCNVPLLNKTAILDYIGLLCGVVGTVCTLYFIIMGIKATEIQNKIDDALKDATRILDTSKTADVLYDYYSELSSLICRYDKKMARDLSLEQGRLVAKIPNLSTDKKKDALRKLAESSVRDDVSLLESFIQKEYRSESMDSEIIDLAITYKNRIADRIKKQGELNSSELTK